MMSLFSAVSEAIGDSPSLPLWHLSLPQALLLAALTSFLVIVVAAALRPSLYPSVRGPKSPPLLGHIYHFLAWGPLKCLTSWCEEYGEVFKFRVGLKETLVVADPELVKEVAVKQFKVFRNRPTPDELQLELEKGIVLGRDKYWAIARGATLAWFHNSEHLESYMGIMRSHVSSLSAELSKLPDGTVVDIHERLQVLTLAVFWDAAFGPTLQEELHAQASALAREVGAATKSLSIPTPSSVLAFFVPTRAAKIVNWALGLVPGTQENTRKNGFLHRALLGEQLLRARLREQQEGQERRDVLSQLLRAQAKAEQGEVKLTHSELMFILAELILAGTDTTSNTIAFAIFLLATHPAMEARLVDEIRGLRETYPPTVAANLEKYKFTQMVVKETLRLYPTGAQLFREAMENTTVGSIPVPKGGQIMFPLWLLHRNPRYFPDPDAFIPDRFDPEGPEAKRCNMAAFLPFGCGPRMCLGTRFALQEAALALITLLAEHRFAPAGPAEGLSGKDAIGAQPVDLGIIIKPEGGLFVHVSKRTE